MIKGTMGQLLINEVLPEELRDYNRVLDKKGMTDLLREVAEKHPDRYKEVSARMLQVGRDSSQESGGMSFSIRHLRKSKAGVDTNRRVRAQLDRILERDDLDDDQRRDLIVRAAGREMKPQQEAILQEALDTNNPLGQQVLSGSRGNKMNLASLLGSDLLYSDHHDRPVPIPVMHSYSEGLTPAEYWAGAYGARKGITATKFATADAGFLSKQLNQVAHRLVVEDDDYEDEEQRNILRGMPVDTDDMDNEGALLAHDIGPYKRNTHLSPKVLKHLKRLGHDRILIRSPSVGGAPGGGVYARDVGVRERGNLPGRGEMVGLQAVQALSEPLSQGQLSAKHSGGVAGEEKAVGGFQSINQLVQVPKTFKGGAAHATLDGTVQRIEKAPAGGQYVTVNGEQHYVGRGFELKVKKGDKIEAGDVLSEGIPNPQKIVQYKGVGEGRRYFAQTMRQAMQDAGIKANRRNIELLGRGLINHVRVTEEYGDWVPDDVIPYASLEHRYKPREDHEVMPAKRALGMYLERPILHYSIGTQVKPSMLKELKQFGVNDLTVHKNPPPFQSEMVRGMYSLQHDPDWMTRFYGSGLKKGLLKGVHRGATSEERGTSFVPSLARSVDFGRQPNSYIKQPEPGKPIQPELGKPEEKDPQQGKPKPSWFGGSFSPGGFASSPPIPKAASCTFGEFIKTAVEEPSVPKPSGQKQGRRLDFGQGGPSFAPGRQATPSMFDSPMGQQMAPQLIGAFNQSMPGIGGVMGLGMTLNADAFNTLTSGQRYNVPQRYGAGGYQAPSMGGFGGMFGGGGPGAGPGASGLGGGYGAGGFVPGGQGTHQPTGTGKVPDTTQTDAAEPGFWGKALGQASEAMDALYWGRYFRPNAGIGRLLSGESTRPGEEGQITSGWDLVSRDWFGPAQAASRGLSPYVGRGMSALWRLPAQGLGHLPGVRGTATGEWLRGVKTFAPANAAAAKPMPAWYRAAGETFRKTFPRVNEFIHGQPSTGTGRFLQKIPGVRQGLGMPPAPTPVVKPPPLPTTATVVDDTAAAAAGAVKPPPIPGTAAASTADEAAVAAANVADEAAVAAANVADEGVAAMSKLSPGTQQLLTTADDAALAADDAAALAAKLSQNIGQTDEIVQIATKSGKIMTFLRGAGGVLRVVGKAAGPIGYVIDAGITGHRVLKGESKEYADETAQEMRDILSGKWGWWTPLGVAGIVFSPSRNINLIVQGGKQAIETAYEVGKTTGETYQMGDKMMQAHQENPNQRYNPLQQDDREYQTFDDVWEGVKENPYNLFAADVDQITEFANVKGQARAVKRQARQTEQQVKQVQLGRLAELRARQAAGEELTAGELQDIERLVARDKMTDYERLNEGKGLIQRAQEDILLERPALIGAEKWHIPGLGWEVKRFATPGEIWRGEFSLNPFNKRGADSFPLIGGFGPELYAHCSGS